MTVDAEQRSRLLRAKLGALVRAQGVLLRAESVGVGAITAVMVDGHAFALAEEGTPAAVSSALVWAGRQAAHDLTLFVDDHAEDVARWASYFVLGAGVIEVRAIVGANSRMAAASPVPVPAGPVDGDAADAEGAALLIDQLGDAGAEVVIEHGVIRGEILGLEIARLVVWPTGSGGDGNLHLEPGVGRFDRDAVAAAHPDESPTAGLARSVHAVTAHRYPGAPAHPIQMLARERWLRADVVRSPELVGARRLRAVSMTTEANGLRDAHPAAAMGEDLDGRPLVVVCSSGVDLSLVPLAADTRELQDPTARLVLALPERDHHAATLALAQMLRRPAELVVVPVGWG